MHTDEQMDASIAQDVMGGTFWREQRGEYQYVILQKAGDREPWTNTQRVYQDEAKKQYTKIDASEIDFFKQINPWHDRFRPTRDIAAAFEVVEKMRMDHPDWYFSIYSGDAIGKKYTILRARFGDSTVIAEDGALPLAICQAALQALRAGGKE